MTKKLWKQLKEDVTTSLELGQIFLSNNPQDDFLKGKNAALADIQFTMNELEKEFQNL